jgi:glycosyltransferase involved in cell wall biosynthesis
LFVNFVETRKGIFELGTAFDSLAARYPRAKLIFAGKVNVLPDGKPISTQVLKRIRPEYHDRVEFLGWQSREQVRDLLRKAHVCCYPSHLEAFALAPLEAMSTGRPVIFAAHGAGPEAIEHGVSGLLCNARDPRDIEEKISLIFDNPDVARKIGQAARERAVQLFSQREWVNRNLQLYQSLCSNGQP